MISATTNEPRPLTEPERTLHASVPREYLDVRDEDALMIYCLHFCVGVEIHVLGMRGYGEYDFAVVHSGDDNPPGGRVGKYSDGAYGIPMVALRDAIIAAWGPPQEGNDRFIKEGPKT